MRKLSVLFVALAVLALSLVPAFAQDTSELTIAEIVVASAGAETPEFSVLLTAVQAADPAVLEALSNPEAQLTVFAPTDAAFGALFEALGEEAVAGLLADTEALTSVLLFHVADGAITSDLVVAQLGMTGGVAALESLNGQYIDIAQDEEGTITINGAGLVTVDVMASNGVIHVIDSVILPESRDLPTLVTDFASAETPEFSTLLTAVAAAGLVDTLADPEAYFTVFAPTDAAFAALPAETLSAALADVDLLTAVLTYHVVAGKVGTAELGEVINMAMSEEDMTEEMPEWFVGITEDGGIEIATVNGASIVVYLSMDEEGMLSAMVNEANIVLTDVDATNGLVHVIDAVILPPMGE
ncbi:MAG: fasciclin domain-containing protein [Anaerolineae bacterium]|nr:fasciclin domain-containing protein [Anaerolineae bacterium]